MGSTYEDASTVDTVVGTLSAISDVATSPAGVGGTLQAHAAVANAGGASGLGIMGGIGLGLSAYGLAESIHDMTANGANGENVSNAVFSGAGVGAGLSTIAGGTAGTVAAPLLTAFAAGGALGNAGNAYAKRKGLAGKGADGENRSYSDMASDWGVSAKEFGGDGLIGDVLGVGATYAGSLVGAAGTIVNAPSMAIDAVGDMITGPTAFQGAMDFVKAQNERPSELDMVKNFGRPSELDLIRRMQGQGAIAQQAANRRLPATASK